MTIYRVELGPHFVIESADRIFNNTQT